MTAGKKSKSSPGPQSRPKPSTRPNAPGKRETYHHGDIEKAAIEAALSIASTQGPAAVTLRAVAAAVGVNHRALYRRFSSHETLLLQVACIGFARLGDRIESAPADDSAEARLARAYATFALEESGLHALMFSLPLRLLFEDAGDLGEALRRVVRTASANFSSGETGRQGEQSAREQVVRVWGLSHGLVTLYRAGALRARSKAAVIEYIARAAEHLQP